MKKIALFLIVGFAFFGLKAQQEVVDPPEGTQQCYDPNGNNYCYASFDGQRCYVERWGQEISCCAFSM